MNTKVNLKLPALAIISKFMNTVKLRMIMKALIESQFEYCPLVWMFHSRTLNNKINRLHERASSLQSMAFWPIYWEHQTNFFKSRCTFQNFKCSGAPQNQVPSAPFPLHLNFQVHPYFFRS